MKILLISFILASSSLEARVLEMDHATMMVPEREIASDEEARSDEIDLKNEQFEIFKTEVFYPVECHPKKGLLAYPFDPLRRYANLDAVSTYITRASIDKENVTISGVLLGLTCRKKEKNNPEDDYKWKMHSLNKNGYVKASLMAEQFFFYDKNFDIELRDNGEFFLVIPISEYLPGRLEKKFLRGEDLSDLRFSISFHLKDRDGMIIPTTGFFTEFKYNVKNTLFDRGMAEFVPVPQNSK